MVKGYITNDCCDAEPVLAHIDKEYVPVSLVNDPTVPHGCQSLKDREREPEAEDLEVAEHAIVLELIGLEFVDALKAIETRRFETIRVNMTGSC